MREAVELSWYELAIAASVGSRRQIEAIRKKLPESHGCDGLNGWTHHIEGAAGEMALARHLNWYWNGSVNTFKRGADVGRVHVRTRSELWHDLLIRKDDPDGVFVLVITQCPVYQIVGWIETAEAKRKEFLKAHGNREPAFFVPQSLLRPACLLNVNSPSVPVGPDRESTSVAPVR